MSPNEWNIGGLVGEQFVGLRVSRWPEYRRDEWNASLHLGPLQLSARLLVRRKLLR